MVLVNETDRCRYFHVTTENVSLKPRSTQTSWGRGYRRRLDPLYLHSLVTTESRVRGTQRYSLGVGGTEVGRGPCEESGATLPPTFSGVSGRCGSRCVGLGGSCSVSVWSVSNGTRCNRS